MKKTRRLRKWVWSALLFILLALLIALFFRIRNKLISEDVATVNKTSNPSITSASESGEINVTYIPETSEAPSEVGNNTTVSEVPEESSNAHSIIQDAIGNWLVDGNDLWIIANKSHKLADGYQPSDLMWGYDCTTGVCYMREPAAEAVQEMIAAAAEDGVYLYYSSAYRGEDYQRRLYENYSAKDGSAVADRYSSRPGYSDHQTGLSADFGSTVDSSANLRAEPYAATPEGQWLYMHAHEYGFVERYPKGKEEITGYEYESWHYRYVGKDAAEAMYAISPDLSMEEYFGFEGGLTYKD